MKNEKIKAYNVCLFFLALVMIIACINAVDVTLDNYGKFSWYLDYSEGFLKRALPGQLLRLYYFTTNQPFTYKFVNESIQTIHIIFVVLFLCMLVSYYFLLVRKYEDKLPIISLLFGFLLSSYFVKEIFELTGYLDIIVSTLTLVSYILYQNKSYLLSVIIISVSCFVSEISMFFWLPVIAVNIFIINASKPKIFLLLIPILVALSIHFLSCVPESLPKMYINSDMSQGIIRYINKLFTEQRDIPSLIKDRFTIISQNIINVIIGFFYLSSVSICFYLISIERISKFQFKSRMRKVLAIVIFSICSFAPSFLILLAVDFWRLIYFSVFSSFLVLTLIGTSINDFSVSAKFLKFILLVSFVISTFTLFSPPVVMSETKMTVKNNAIVDTISLVLNHGTM